MAGLENPVLSLDRVQVRKEGILELLRSAWLPNGVLAYLQGFQPPALSSSIHPSAQKWNSANFALTAF
jgi:hypothetical protein